jgi:hypothetical protein
VLSDRDLADLLSRAAEFIKGHPKFGACLTEHDPGHGVVIVEKLQDEARARYTESEEQASGHRGENA